MKETIFSVKKMDCPCEENLIKMKFAKFNHIKEIKADFIKRELKVIHEEEEAVLQKALGELNLDSGHISTTTFSGSIKEQKQDKKLLWQILIINFVFFIIEMIYGVLSDSMGLIADGLDMLSDSLVYAMALYAVTETIIVQKKVALMAGGFQLLLACFGFFEVANRFLSSENDVDFKIMIIVSLFALAANWACLYLLNKSNSDKAHMKASMIFTSNDIIVNIGVMAAGVLVYVSGSHIPDLVIGFIVFAVVFRGSIKIINLAR